LIDMIVLAETVASRMNEIVGKVPILFSFANSQPRARGELPGK